jgi:hypothetical protein
MNVQLVRIADRGVPNAERVHLSVVAATDLSYFVVLKTFRIAPALTNVAAGTAAAYWFHTTPVKAGDQVVLYSAKGTPSKRTEPSGATTHFFYWGFPNTLWNTPGDCVVVTQVAEWLTSPYDG